MATSAGQALLTLMEPHRLMFLSLGCIMGLVLGILPGIGGLAGTALLLPFTFDMDPYYGVRAAARPRRDHRDRRSDPGDPVRRARRRRPRPRPCSTASRWPSAARPAARSAPPTCRR